MPNRDPDHRQVEAAVQKWFAEKTERRSFSARWNPAEGIETFRLAFDPAGELGQAGGVFTPHANGDLMVHWANQTHVISPGGTWTYRPRRDRTMPLPEPAPSGEIRP